MNSSRQLSGYSTLSLAVLGGVLATACTSEKWSEQRRFAMGTWVDTIYAAPDRATEQRIELAVDDLLQRFEIDYYAWADGELGQINSALAQGRSATANPAMLDLLQRSVDLYEASDGLFDPGVGALVEAWGFHSAEAQPREPDAEFLRRWRERRPSIRHLDIRGHTIAIAAQCCHHGFGTTLPVIGNFASRSTL